MGTEDGMWRDKTSQQHDIWVCLTIGTPKNKKRHWKSDDEPMDLIHAHTNTHKIVYIYILYMHIYSGIFHDNSNSSSISKCHCALHVTGRGSQTLGASWFCRMLSSSCKDCARVSSRWAGGFNPQETHGKFRGNGNGRMNVFFPGKIWKYYHFHQMIFHIRYGNNQPWLIFLGSLFNSKWRSVKVFPGIERPTVRIPKTVLVVSSCWPSWFISRGHIKQFVRFTNQQAKLGGTTL